MSKWKNRLFLGAASTLSTLVFAQESGPAEESPSSNIKEIIVTVDPGSSEYLLLNQMTKVYNTHAVAEELKENVGGVVEVKPLDKLGMVTVRGDAQAIEEALSRMPNVKEVERDSVVHTFAFTSPANSTSDQTTGNNNIYSDMGMTTVPTNKAKACAGGVSGTDCANTDVTVAILDTGLNTSHEMFSGRIDTANQKNLTGASSDSNVADGYGHGTHVASLVLAGHDQLLSNLNWSNASIDATLKARIKILPVRVMADDGSGRISDVIEGLNYVQGLSNVKVVNLSIGTDCFSTSMFSAMNSVYKSGTTGKFFAVAAGNNYLQNLNTSPIFPAVMNIPGMLSVGSVKQTTSGAVSSYLSSFTNVGTRTVDVFANGSVVLDRSGTTNDNKIYGAGISSNTAAAYMEGTSMAAPFVAGLAAAMVVTNREITAKGIAEAIAATATDSGTKNVYVKSGIINASAALDASLNGTYDGIENSTGTGNQYRSDSAPSCSTTSAGGSSGGVATGGGSSSGGGCLAVTPVNPNDPTNGPLGGNGILLVSLMFYVGQVMRRLKRFQK